MGRNMKKLAALATVGLLTLAGCANGSPHAAAYVGDTQISLAQVEKVASTIAGVSSDPTDTGTAYRNDVVQIMISSQLTKSTGIKPTDAQRQAVLGANGALSTLGQVPDLSAFINDWVDAQAIVGTDAGRAAYIEVVKKTEIKLNPRFGTWDPNQAAIVDGSSGSISEVAPIKG